MCSQAEIARWIGRLGAAKLGCLRHLELHARLVCKSDLVGTLKVSIDLWKRQVNCGLDVHVPTHHCDIAVLVRCMELVMLPGTTPEEKGVTQAVTDWLGSQRDDATIVLTLPALVELLEMVDEAGKSHCGATDCFHLRAFPVS